MTGIAQDIQRYNLAFKLAWKHVSELPKHRDPHIALRLHYSIRRQLKAGATEPVFIAAEALSDIGKPRTPNSTEGAGSTNIMVADG